MHLFCCTHKVLIKSNLLDRTRFCSMSRLAAILTDGSGCDWWFWFWCQTLIELALLFVWALELFVTFFVTVEACGDAWWARFVMYNGSSLVITITFLYFGRFCMFSLFCPTFRFSMSDTLPSFCYAMVTPFSNIFFLFLTFSL